MNFLPPHEVEILRRWFLRGMSIRATVGETGAQRDTVFRYFRAWRKGEQPIPNEEIASGRVETCISLEAKNSFVIAAKTRGIPIHKLIREILETVAEDKLFDAILDE